MSNDANGGVLVLARADHVRQELAHALSQAGADQVTAVDPNSADPEALYAMSPRAVLVLLEPAIEDALDRYEPLLSNPDVLVLFDEAEIAARRTGWDAVRWLRHLMVKLRLKSAVEPAQSDPVAGIGNPPSPAPGSSTAGSGRQRPQAAASYQAADAPVSAETGTVGSWWSAGTDPSIGHPAVEVEENGAALAISPLLDTGDQDAGGGSRPEPSYPDIRGADVEPDAAEDPGGDVRDADDVWRSLAMELEAISRAEPEADLEAETDFRAADAQSGAGSTGVDEVDLDAWLALNAAGDPSAAEPEPGSATGSDGVSGTVGKDTGKAIEWPSDWSLVNADIQEDKQASPEAEAWSNFTSRLTLAAMEDDDDPVPEADARPAESSLDGAQPVAGDGADMTGLQPLWRASGDMGPGENGAMRLEDYGSEAATAFPAGGVGRPRQPGGVYVQAGLGGPDAVRQFLAAIAPGFDRPILVRLHLDAGHYDRLVRQMARVASIPVSLAVPGQPLDPGVGYFLPPDVGVESENGRQVFTRDEAAARKLPLDWPSSESAYLFLSGSEPAMVDMAMDLGLGASGALLAGQAPEGCYDPVAALRLISRGGSSGSPAQLARELQSRWPPSEGAAAQAPGGLR